MRNVENLFFVLVTKAANEIEYLIENEAHLNDVAFEIDEKFVPYSESFEEALTNWKTHMKINRPDELGYKK